MVFKSISFFCKKEFTCKNWLFSVNDPKVLVECKWTIRPIIYILYRVFVFVYVWGLFSWIVPRTPQFYAALTFWGYIAIMINFTIKFINVIYYNSWLSTNTINSDSSSEDSGSSTAQCCQISVLLQLSWIMTNVATPVSLLITTVYWIFLFPNKQHKFPDYDNIQIHAINAVLCVLDLTLINIPYRFLHFYQPSLFALLYTIFNFVYWKMTGEVVYVILNWSNLEKSAVTVIGSCFLIIVFHLLLLLFVKVVNKFRPNKIAVSESIEINEIS